MENVLILTFFYCGSRLFILYSVTTYESMPRALLRCLVNVPFLVPHAAQWLTAIYVRQHTYNNTNFLTAVQLRAWSTTIRDRYRNRQRDTEIRNFQQWIFPAHAQSTCHLVAALCPWVLFSTWTAQWWLEALRWASWNVFETKSNKRTSSKLCCYYVSYRDKGKKHVRVDRKYVLYL